MSSRHRILPIAFVLLFGALAAGPAAAVPVPIANPGFDADHLPLPGDDQPTITGWDTTAGGGDGIFRPTTSDYPLGIPSGQNLAYTNGPGNRVAQVLTTLLEPNTRYVLKVEVGWNRNDPFAGYLVRLLTEDNTLLAEDNSSQSPAQGSFVTSMVTFTTGDAHAKLGSKLKILLSSPGIQANFDDVRLDASPATYCAETLLLPFFLVDTQDPGGTQTLYAVRNLTGGTVTADVEYFTVGGASQGTDTFTLDADDTRTVSLRSVPGLATDNNGFARGFAKIVTTGTADRTPVLAGDFFQVDVDGNFATGDELVRLSEVCTKASIRFLDFGAGTRLTVWLNQPRGGGGNPASFTVEVFDENGNLVSGPIPVKTNLHALELQASDFTPQGVDFGFLKFDFTNGLGGTVYAEYSADGKFSVGVSSECGDPRSCETGDCCPPGAPKALAAGLHYPKGQEFPGCPAAIDDAVRALDSFHYRNACQETHGGPMPDAVLGARVVSCQVDPPGSPNSVVVAVEVCCPPN